MYIYIKRVAKFKQKLLNPQNLYCKLYIYLVVDDLPDFSKGQAFECFHAINRPIVMHIVYCLFVVISAFVFVYCIFLCVCMYVSFFFWCYHFGE